MLGREKSIAEDLKDFLKKHIVPLKKGEVLRARGEPLKDCPQCRKRKYWCTCWKVLKGRYYA